MSIKFHKDEAAALVRAAAAEAEAGQLDPDWLGKVARLSALCDAGGGRTHIAFLATAMVAKALRSDVDLLAIKPSKAAGNPKAYSARGLCERVLVPLAVDLGFSLGATGREPLNNQPYFRIARLGDDTPVSASSRAAFSYLLNLVNELQGLRSQEEARAALAAFIAERRRHTARYSRPAGEARISPEELPEAVRSLVQEGSEGGRLAQAVVAGLMDTFAGPERVESGRVNDPSRRHPGDVCVRAVDADVWEKAFEIRDKPVSMSDVQIFGDKCVSMGVREAAVVAVDDAQRPLDRRRLAEWSRDLGIGMTLFEGWESIIEQALFWAGDPKPVAARRAVAGIHDRLIAAEASPAAVNRWARLTGMGVGT